MSKAKKTELARRRYEFYGYYEDFAPYVSTAQRSRAAEQKIAELRQKGKAIDPVRLDGTPIARTFWGKAWCKNLETYGDFANRLSRGRSYVRSGTVIDLQIARGRVTAMVSGSSLYRVTIRIEKLEPERWSGLVRNCSTEIKSLVEVLQGHLSQSVMETITSKDRGMFPAPRQITMDCSCPDQATMCKHVAAVLYGVGARLDRNPELFFVLRNVDHTELIAAAGADAATVVTRKPNQERVLKSNDLSAIFGIDIAVDEATPDADAASAPTVTRKSPAPKGNPAAKMEPDAVKKPSAKCPAANRPAAKKKPGAKNKPVPKKKPAAKGSPAADNGAAS